MDWTTGLQRAIDYVEDHLAEPLDYADENPEKEDTDE